MKIEADVWPPFVTQLFEQSPFRSRQRARVAVDVNGLQVAPLEEFSSVRVEHRDGAQCDLFFDCLHPPLTPVLLQIGEEVYERAGRRRLIAVHLRPHEDLERPAPELKLVDGAVCDRTPDFFNADAPRAKLVEIFLKIGVLDERRIKIRQAIRLPLSKKLARRLRAGRCTTR